MSPPTAEEDGKGAIAHDAGDPGTTASPGIWRKLSKVRAVEAVADRDFRLLWLGHSFSSVAFWMDQVSRGWLIYELTDSALQLGLIRGVQAIPTLFLSPLAGSTADRYSRKMQIMIAQVADGLMLAALAMLIFTGRVEPWHVYVTAFGMAIVQAFQQPARAAIIADTIPSTHLTNAIGLNSIIFNVARSTGPGLAGVLIAAFGTGGSYATQAVCYLLATFSMALMVVVGFANVCSHALVQTVIQTYSPSEFRGRTMSVLHMSNVVMTLGSMLIGALATLAGTRAAVALMGTAGALAMLAIHLALPRARHIR